MDDFARVTLRRALSVEPGLHGLTGAAAQMNAGKRADRVSTKAVTYEVVFWLP